MDYPHDFSLKYPTEPPPAYSNITKNDNKMNNFVDDGNFKPLPANLNVAYESSDEDDNMNEFGGMSSINKKTSINNAIGNSFALAG